MKDIKMNNFRALYTQKIEKKQPQHPNNTEKIHLIVLTGTYGSNKLKFAQNLAKFGPNSNKYSVFRIST
jgi:hypothetical protein